MKFTYKVGLKMKSWGIILVIAVGFGIGMAAPKLAAEMGISKATASVNSVLGVKASNTKDSSKVEDFWVNTELDISDLKASVNNVKCHQTKREFLACINSVLFALQKTNLHLKFDGTIAQNMRRETKLDNYNEKQNLAQFLNLYSDGLSDRFNFDKLWNSVLALSKPEQKKYILALGINGYLSIMMDPHTYISPTDFFRQVSSNNERSKFFLGLSFEKKMEKIFIRKVFKNSDADQAGLRNNDEVISINGQKVEDMNLADVSTLLKDKNQKTFPFLIKRGKASFVKKLNRTYRVLSQVQSEVINNGNKIGYIQLSKFAYNICENVRAEIEKMKPSTLNGLVLDLRDNPGGLLTEAACLAGLFIGEDKKIFTVKYTDGSEEEVALTTSEQVYFGPMAILTNNSSASASELIAGAMQEYNRATIIGERTFGKGSFQEIERWNESSSISLFKTQGFYLLPSGETTQLKGVMPDVVLDDENAVMSEFDLYQFPLHFKADKRSTMVHNLMYKKSTRPTNCAHSSVKGYAEDKFIASAQQVLGCEIALSLKADDKEQNINL
jgi:carboxyl-terminal processing protease